MVRKNCWNCAYKKNKQISLFGVCLYFLHIGKEAKDIPETVVDKGCEYFVERADNKEVRGTIQMVIEFFDGEILEDKTQYRKIYKRKKIKDTRNKYGKRKDWE